MRPAPARARMCGLTLVELTVSVSIAGLLILGGAALGTQAWADYRADQFGERLVAFVDEVEGLFTVRNDYLGLATDSAGPLGLLRHESVAGQHLYGGSMTLGVLTGVGLNNQAWGVHYADVPAAACLTVLRTALAVGDAVALRPGAGGVFSNWSTGLSRAGGVISGYPNDYKVVKDRRDAVPTVAAQVEGCTGATTRVVNGVTIETPFGLAVVRGKL